MQVIKCLHGIIDEITLMIFISAPMSGRALPHVQLFLRSVYDRHHNITWRCAQYVYRIIIIILM
jgi:hypothetical protein